jgi:dienelactone hydrolase
LLIKESYTTPSRETFDVEIAPAPTDGKKYPVVVLIHGNLGLDPPFGKQLRDFTEEISGLGYLAALPSYLPGGRRSLMEAKIAAHVPAVSAAIEHVRKRPDADRTASAWCSSRSAAALRCLTSPPSESPPFYAER